jgi:putative ABC transport system ATP-binding protein
MSPASGGGPAIDARGLTKVYGKGNLAFTAVRAVDFTLDRGEVVLMEGPSGSGKTTLLSMLGCVLEPTEGRIDLLGDPVDQLSDRAMAHVRLQRIGFVFQGGNLVDALSARRNVAFPLQLQGRSAKHALKLADELLERVELGDKRHARPAELSGGQRQRVSVARAMAGDPPILLADEPTAALDAKTGLRVTTLMRDLARQRGTSVLIVSHDNRIEHLADRIVRLEDGRVVQNGTREDA